MCVMGFAYHQGASHDSVRETGEVLNVGGGGQLTSGGDAVGHEALIEDSCASCEFSKLLIVGPRGGRGYLV